VRGWETASQVNHRVSSKEMEKYQEGSCFWQRDRRYGKCPRVLLATITSIVQHCRLTYSLRIQWSPQVSTSNFACWRSPVFAANPRLMPSLLASIPMSITFGSMIGPRLISAFLSDCERMQRPHRGWTQYNQLCIHQRSCF